MSWMEYCCKTYDNCQSEVGKKPTKGVPLLPLSHTTQNVNIEVELDENGNFIEARLVPEFERITIIPCTEASATRTSGPAAHPLVDKLQYIAADYAAFGGPKEPRWSLYHSGLAAWCNSSYAIQDVCTVLLYLEKECLIQDLVNDGILSIDENGKLPTKWAKGEAPPVCSTIVGGDQTESFVRFTVNGRNLESPKIQESFRSFYSSQLKETDLCMVQGREMPISQSSPYKVRNAGDHAKLISSNDSVNFTYRGRFASPRQALSVGYETTQKAHNALRWLIGKQGVHNDDQVILVWGTQDEPVPNPTADSFSLVRGGGWDPDAESDDVYDVEAMCSTQEAFAERFNQVIAGYRQKLDNASQTAVMILDSATPGRLSIRYYHELPGSRLLGYVESWHTDFAWQQEYRTVKKADEPGKKPTSKTIAFIGAPALKAIAEAAYGEKADAKLIQKTIERLLPCVIQGHTLPRDIMLKAVNRATNSYSLEGWQARKVQGVACALVRGYCCRSKKEDISMSIDPNMLDRSYLFGRILACAEQIERYAQQLENDTSKTRPTNAERLRVAFVQQPANTTAVLQNQLAPYISRLRANGKSTARYDLMLELIDKLGSDDFTNHRLSEMYLLGYASQKMEFKNENKQYEATKAVESNN